ncbi:CHC2 zinc finger domain-containing protein [Candidatus Manganitrophus noduliformans]|uniref:Toprim domain-containing protein n=1 Tax=Candidatus Manganitrophus noduliformans TaxID=2606439 RepID=A0A7X6DMX8_9BACT|nr:CHC2 zinc finger domain-containing protein [Candidatus Manganitrophus noduliformans]NKE70182.1 toprim domain-containing protein [Candidatus Manganitrophus noduliformans]
MGHDFQEVKQRLDIVVVIEKYTGLTARRSGNNYLLSECPFCHGHGCFSIKQEEQFFKCFQCPGDKTGGDVFTFLSKLKGVDQRSALEELAREAGYALRSQSTRPDVKEAIMRWAKEAWEAPGAKEVWEYLVKERKLSEEILRSHDIGFLHDRSKMTADLKKQGYHYEEIRASGILTKGYFDFYRILFGWRGATGSLSGFMAGATRRQLSELNESGRDPQPKYKMAWGFQADSPYHLYDAKRRTDRAVIIVEGVIDCLQMLTIGISNTVALGGTAFKEGYGTALDSTRFERIILMLDSDRAGREATARIIRHLLNGHPKFNLYVAEIAATDPNDKKSLIKDPDELIVKLGPQITRTILNDPIKAGPWLAISMRAELDLTNALQRDEALHRMACLWDRFSDEVEKKEIIRYLSESCRLPQEDIRKTIEKYAQRKKENADRSVPSTEQSKEEDPRKTSAKMEQLEEKNKTLKEKNQNLAAQNKALLRAYAHCVTRIRELSRSGLLWHVNRLTEGHSAVLKQIRKDPKRSLLLLEKINETFDRSSIQDVGRIKAEIDQLCREQVNEDGEDNES